MLMRFAIIVQNASIIATMPWNIIGLDVVGPFPKSSKHPYRYIFIVVDYFTKWIELFALERPDCRSIARILKQDIFARFQNPSCKELKLILEEMNIASDFSATEHQQGNGLWSRLSSLF